MMLLWTVGLACLGLLASLAVADLVRENRRFKKGS